MTVGRPGSFLQGGAALNIADGFRAALALLAVGASSLVFAGEPADSPVAVGDYRDEPFVFERIASSYRIEADGTQRRVAQVRVKAQNEAGVQQLGQQLFPYLAGRVRLKIDYLRVHKLDGSVTDGSPDHLQDLPAPVTAEFPVYSDLRILHATVPAFRPGEVLEYQITDTLEKPEAEDRFWMSHNFQTAAIVLEEILEVNVPAAAMIHLHFGDGLEPEITEGRGRRTYAWKHSNTVRQDVSWEEMVEAASRSDVELSSFRDWQDVGSWYFAVQDRRASPNGAIRRQAKALVAGLASDEDKIAAIYNFVSTEFRYLGLLFGAARYQPHPAEEVLENGYGDCKDKHTLLAALLSAAGYRVSPVLIGTLSEVPAEVPSPESFDHVITAVASGDGWIFLDSTQIAAFGYLAPQVRGKKALLVAGEGASKLVDIPHQLPFQATRSFVLEGKVDATGRLTARIDHHLRGDYEFLLRVTLLSSSRENWFEIGRGLALAFGLPGEVSNFETSDLSDATEPLRLSYSLALDYLNPYGKEQQVDLLLPSNDFPTAPTPKEGQEPEPLELGHPVKVSNRFEIQVPGHFEVRTPVPVAIQREFVMFRSSYQAVDGC